MVSIVRMVMEKFMRHSTLISLASASIFAAPTLALAAPAAMPSLHVRGTIQSVTATAFTVATASGAVKLSLPKTAGVITVLPSSRAAIKDNTFVGIASFPGMAGKQNAAEVVVFPNSMRGAGAGSYPWDLPAPGGMAQGSRMTNGTAMHSRMTNGTVMHSRMTNGTVSASRMTNGAVHSRMTNGSVTSGASGDTLTVSYKGGSQQIALPPNIPYVTFAPGTRSELKPGAHVVVFAIPGNPPTAARVAVGQGTLVPPM